LKSGVLGFDACAIGQIDEIAVQQSADDDDQREDAGKRKHKIQHGSINTFRQ
jgi:hypothetical protein